MEEKKELNTQEEAAIKENVAEKKKKKNPIKGLLTLIIILILVAVGIVGVKKGSAYVMHKQDPESNNLLKIKYDEVGNFDFMITDMVVGSLGEKGYEIAAKYLYPIMEKLYVNEEAPAVENEELNTLLADPYYTYTLEDEEYLMGYQGRKVKLVGTIYQVREDIAFFCTGIDYDSTSQIDMPAGRSILLNLNYLEDRSLIYENSVVELEGFLTVGMYKLENEEADWRLDHFIYVNEMKEADFVALGGDPSELYMHQKSDVNIHVEQDEFIIDISAVTVDAKTGNAVVRFTYAKDAERYFWGPDDGFSERPMLVGIKGKKAGATDGRTILDGRTEYGSIIIDGATSWTEERALSLGELYNKVGISDDVISLYIVGLYEPSGELGEEIIFKDEEVKHAYTVQIDIPSSEWTIYE